MENQSVDNLESNWLYFLECGDTRSIQIGQKHQIEGHLVWIFAVKKKKQGQGLRRCKNLHRNTSFQKYWLNTVKFRLNCLSTAFR